MTMEATVATERCTILVVDDDAEIRESLVEILEHEGWRSFGAANGVEALAALRTGRRAPCLILLDLMMPVMDGATFRAEQRLDPELRDIPVVVITAFRDSTADEASMQPARLLKKPIQYDKLIAVVGEFCSRA